MISPSMNTIITEAAVFDLSFALQWGQVNVLRILDIGNPLWQYGHTFIGYSRALFMLHHSFRNLPRMGK